MVRVIISDGGKREANRLQFDIEAAISEILLYLAGNDLLGLDHILVTDSPEKRWKYLANDARASCFERQGRIAAHIELYLERLYSHVQSAESFGQMLPIQLLGLAQTIFHEVGHHVERTRRHGIKKANREAHAGSYARKVLNQYILKNANAINDCFDHLEQIAEEKALSWDTLGEMRVGWERQYTAALKQGALTQPS